ncbi:MAG: hypothetical protein KGJ86_10140 [Chloroflexota bacterium]|nr:hypothetical protein [Chloroflexota bacterium]
MVDRLALLIWEAELLGQLGGQKADWARPASAIRDHFVTHWRFQAGITEVADILNDPLSLDLDSLAASV